MPADSRATLRVREATREERDRWDELIERFPNHRVLHTRAWVESLHASGCSPPVYLVIEREEEIVGCLPGFLSSLAGWRVFGSPLPGWQTDSMGPVFDPARVSTADLMAALTPFLQREYGVVFIEILHPSLDADAMRAAGFTARPVPTFRTPLYPADPDRVFARFRASARRNVRRAERMGLVVRFEHEESFARQLFEQTGKVFVRGGNALPFSYRRVLELFRHMSASGALLATSVQLPHSDVSIATGMFLCHGRELLLWMWAVDPHYRWYQPTELMTWAAMQRAMAAGCDTMDFAGRGDFKRKFGAEPDETTQRWIHSRPRWLTPVRHAAERGFRIQQAARGRARRLLRAGAARVAQWIKLTDENVVACVLGGMDLVRPLGLAGISSVLLAPPRDLAHYSRFVRRTLPWKDPQVHPQETIELLVSYAARQPQPPVLFYDDDWSLLLVSRHRDRLGKLFRFVLPDETLVEQLADRARFQELAEHLSLPVPPGRVLTAAEEPVPGEHLLPFPAVVKPLKPFMDRWRLIAGGARAFRVNNPAAARALWPRLAAVNLPVLIQRFIPGPDDRLESYHVYIDERDQIIGEFTARRVRAYPSEIGESTSVETTHAPDVAALGRDLVRRLGLRGVAMLEFKRADDGRLYLLAVKPRFTLWSQVGARAGVNLPALVFGDLTGTRSGVTPEARPGLCWCNLREDAVAARAAGLPVWQWLPWALSCETKPAIATDDLFPLVGGALWSARAWLAGVGRRAMRDAADQGPTPAADAP